MTSSDRELRQGVLGGLDSIVMAVAGSAPAYSIAATTAVLIGAVGLASPAALLYCAIPMLGIAWAFNYLGRADVNAGASYSWVGRALHPSLGFLSGWSLVVSATIFMVAGALPAGSLTLSLFSDSAANNTALATLVGAFWFLVMVGLVIAGVTVTARAQWIMTGIEVGAARAVRRPRLRPQRQRRRALLLVLVRLRRLPQRGHLRRRRAGRGVLLLGLGRHGQPQRGDRGPRPQGRHRRPGRRRPGLRALRAVHRAHHMLLTPKEIDGQRRRTCWPVSATSSGPVPAASC